MEEDEPDYRTPIGKILKHINALCKKPQIDDQLSEVVDLFNEKLNEQEKYLVNGIFKINFSEAALFLQSSAELYGKRIDLLWDQLLEFHTRLIKYDCEHQKEKGAPLDQAVIAKLEERRNRYKRKKKFKLILQGSETQKIAEFLIDKEKDAKASPPENEYDSDDEAYQWKEMEATSAKMRRIPKIVYKQMTQQYRLKNYHVLKCQDFEIWDPEDDEFNTKYSRVPGWHHTLHLFEYNDKGLLPDKKNLIATLRLTAYGRIRFMISRKIPLDTPFEKYKDEYMAYRQKFFEEEAKKWQNMPLDTLEDLRKQLQYLVQKEREENGETITDGDNVKLGRYGYVKNITTENSNDKIEILDSTDEESLFELSFSCNNDFTKSDLFVRLEKLSSEIVNTKLRQDSGFYDFNSDSDNDCDNENIAADNLNLGTSGEGTEIAAVDSNKDGSCDGNKETEENQENTAVDNLNLESSNEGGENVAVDANEAGTCDGNKEAEENTENTAAGEINLEISDKGSENLAVDTNKDSTDIGNKETNIDINSEQINNDNENITGLLTEGNIDCAPEAVNDTNDSGNVDNFETRSFISDHDYCLTIPSFLESDKNCESSATDCNANINKNNDSNKSNTTPITKAPKIINTTLNDTGNNLCLGSPRIIPRIIKIIPKKEKRKINRTDDSESPPKRRKLSAKQIEKLLQSKIKPVKERKFENFFSLNYQPQLGEGEVSVVDYESEESDMENIDNESNLDNIQPDNNQPDNNQPDNNQPDNNQPDDNRSIYSAQDDTRSVFSDHDYCQRTAEESYNDSGFIDTSSIQPSLESEPTEVDPKENTPLDKDTDRSQSTAEISAPTPEEDEFERLLAELRASKRDEGQPLTNDDLGPPTEQQLKEKERKEAQARVEEWRSMITPILRNLKENDFDIHEYGSRIMDNMEINETKPFKNMVEGKSSAEVVRYFISSLQLANTYNIEVCGAQHGQLSNDTFSLKLLTKDRYHEHLNEYLAPSEETFREKLERVRAMMAKEQVSSGEPPSKKLKLSTTTRGKRLLTKNKQPVKGKKAKTASNSAADNSYAVASTSSAGLSKPHLGSFIQNSSDATTDVRQVQDENNGSPHTYQTTPVSKGKSILKRHVMCEKSPNTQLLNSDVLMPSASYNSQSASLSTYPAFPKAVVDEQMPSTSYQRLSPPPHDFSGIFSPNTQISYGEPSSEKRRRVSNEDTFRERLVAIQERNPNIQLQSTPNGPSCFKQITTSSSLKKSILFE